MTISTELKAAGWASETDDGPFVLLTISHAVLATPIRVCNAGADVVSNGESFVFYPFTISLPDELEGSPPLAKLTIQNVSQEIVSAVRQMTTAASVLIQVARIKDPDSIEMAWPTLDLRNVKSDAMFVTGDLVITDIFRQAYPAGTFNPTSFRSLFT